eukprot:635935-Amphidinium_carterae.1
MWQQEVQALQHALEKMREEFLQKDESNKRLSRWLKSDPIVPQREYHSLSRSGQETPSQVIWQSVNRQLQEIEEERAQLLHALESSKEVQEQEDALGDVVEEELQRMQASTRCEPPVQS